MQGRRVLQMKGSQYGNTRDPKEHAYISLVYVTLQRTQSDTSIDVHR